MTLITEVHPFDDGNGRVARACMNAELIAAQERRILIPTVYRDDYLGALRRFTRQQDVTLLPRVLDRAQALSAQIDFTDRPRAQARLTETHAFLEPTEAKLLLPSEIP
jgi:Fic family protein